MSYFIAGFKTTDAVFQELDKLYDGILPSPLRSASVRITRRASRLISYAGNRAISDFVILDDRRGSWFVAVGTPLLSLPSEKEKQDFLTEFFANPAHIVNHVLDGNFAVFAYDASRDVFYAASDFNNTIPIFYHASDGGVLFTSHELALAKLIKPEIDPGGFFQSIQLGVTWGGGTRFKNMNKTLPCQIISVDSQKTLRKETYWRPGYETLWSASFDQLIESWLLMLRNIIWKYYECGDKKPTIADFTAGEDSRLLLAQIHALGIPFKAQVRGSEDDVDVVVAKRAADHLGFELIVRPMHWITTDKLLSEALKISWVCDAYKEFTFSCVDIATEDNSPIDDYHTVKYCGVPGGEAFRGAYYLRGKAIFPSRKTRLDIPFFIKMKYLLDYYPKLLCYSDGDGLADIFALVRENLAEVSDFPIGTQIDHLIRVFQTGSLGLKYKNPLYLPFASNHLTRSVYIIPPKYKRGGRLTKACTEILYPELARIKTQKGVPTIRRTFIRFPLFIPEAVSPIKQITSGTVSRLLKIAKGNKWYYSQDSNAYIFQALFNNLPYSKWFSSAASMKTGYLYKSDNINRILEQAKNGSFRHLPLLGRIVNQELACRWIYP